MLRDTIHKLPNDGHSVPGNGFSGVYNDFQFSIKVTALPLAKTTNYRARQTSGQNEMMAARKHVLGLGHGQYKEPDSAPVLEAGKAILEMRLGSSVYKLPIKFNAEGEYSSPLLTRKASSLREVAIRLMDGLFEHFSIPNDAKEHRERMARRPEIAANNGVIVQSPSRSFRMN